MKAYMAGLAVVLVATIVVFAVGHPVAAGLVGQGGTLGWIVICLAWSTFADSQRRGPGRSAFTRFAKVITFRC